MAELDLNAVRIEVDAEERDDVSSWVSATTYAQVLADARRACPPGRHLMTLREYVELWQQTVRTGGSRACNSADAWVKRGFDLRTEPETSFRHPFKSTILVDLWLQDFSFAPDIGYTAVVYEAGFPKGDVHLPLSGKIYELNAFGLPARTGGRKTSASDAFEHRWWAFSSDEIRDAHGEIRSDARLAVFANGGTIGCFCELIKVHYRLEDAGGFYRVLSVPDGF